MLLNMVMICSNSTLKGQDTIFLKTILIAQMTFFITKHILDMFITNNSLHIKKLQPYANLYITHATWTSIWTSILFLISHL
jgi:hypothetical protein